MRIAGRLQGRVLPTKPSGTRREAAYQGTFRTVTFSGGRHEEAFASIAARIEAMFAMIPGSSSRANCDFTAPSE